MPRYMVVLIEDDADSRALTPAETLVLAEGHAAYERELRAAGAFLDGERLRPSAEGRRVAARDGQPPHRRGPLRRRGPQRLRCAHGRRPRRRGRARAALPAAAGRRARRAAADEGPHPPRRGQPAGARLRLRGARPRARRAGLGRRHGPHRREHRRGLSTRALPRRRAHGGAGLAPDNECYAACAKGWTFYIERSLRDFIETGVGDPKARHGR